MLLKIESAVKVNGAMSLTCLNQLKNIERVRDATPPSAGLTGQLPSDEHRYRYPRKLFSLLDHLE